jgi:hypothetical protein
VENWLLFGCMLPHHWGFRLRVYFCTKMPATLICHVRLKRSGAWWYEVNSNQMLALRCAKYNGTLDQVFARYQQRLREMSE